jgi:hypothetical protein
MKKKAIFRPLDWLVSCSTLKWVGSITLGMFGAYCGQEIADTLFAAWWAGAGTVFAELAYWKIVGAN